MPEGLMDTKLLIELSGIAREAEGGVIEIGVYQGASAEVLCGLFPGREIFLCDTFCGMPEPGPNDGHREGDFRNTTADAVRERLAGFDDVHIFEGHFPDGVFPEEYEIRKDLSFCFAHVDCDLEASVRDSCEWCYPLMSSGGVMLFDDYGFGSCKGAKIAVDEFVAKIPETLVHVGLRAYLVKH